MKKKQKTEIISFKADESLLEALEAVPNRSEFIRDAVSTALDCVCPLCHGTGLLSPSQRGHWEEFTATHAIVKCNECHEEHLVCRAQTDEKAG